MEELISVCIPAYESPELFERALISVLSQQGCDFEIIITDDSEGDSVSAVVERHRKEHQIRYLKNENRLGAVNNWNRALSLADGCVKKLLHHDDWFVDEYSLKELVSPILDNEADIVFSNCLSMGKKGIIGTHNIETLKMKELITYPENLVFGNIIGAPSVMAISSSINVIFNPRFLWVSDIDFYIRAIRASKLGVVKIEKPLLCILADGENQISRDCENNRSRSILEFMQLIKQESPYLNFKKDVPPFISNLVHDLGLSDLLTLNKNAIIKGDYHVINYTYRIIAKKLLHFLE
ncbi:glycosyltransferase family 2 protein [Polynucleobacter paneuropaeus]|nr:glycosyltransferase family 2 protein [Polynucleobacter paneuropaeus]